MGEALQSAHSTTEQMMLRAFGKLPPITLSEPGDTEQEPAKEISPAKNITLGNEGEPTKNISLPQEEKRAKKFSPVQDFSLQEAQDPAKEISPVKNTSPGDAKKITPVKKSLLGEQAKNILPAKKISPVAADYFGFAIDACVAATSLAAFGFLTVLHAILPPEGGLLRVNALARALGLSRRTLQIQLQGLEEAGVIQCGNISQEGREIFFTGAGNFTREKFFATSSSCSLETTTTTTASAETRAGVEKNTGDFNAVLRRHKEASFRSGIFAALLASGVKPEQMPDAMVFRLVRMAENTSIEDVAALVLEYVPRAKSNPAGYLHGVIEKGGTASTASREKAAAVLTALEAIRKEIGVEILPDDWIAAVRVLKMQATRENALLRQTELIERMDRFAKN